MCLEAIELASLCALCRFYTLPPNTDQKNTFLLRVILNHSLDRRVLISSVERCELQSFPVFDKGAA